MRPVPRARLVQLCLNQNRSLGNLVGNPPLLLVLACSFRLIGACGGTSTSPPPSATNPAPTIAALSPNSSTLGGPGFTLSVVGTNFVPASTVRWNGSAVATTTLVNSTLVTADIPASAVATTGPDVVTVVNPLPGGGISNSLNFLVPCVIPPPAPASTQIRARVGAYYFDGWAGSLTREHFNGLVNGPYQDRQPLSGWQDNSACAIERQLAWAHNFGIDFLIFDWYFKPETSYGEPLNSALQITHSLPDRHGMEYAILYVSGPPFVVSPADWQSAVNEWVAYMTDPAYLRVHGMAAFFIINVGQVHQDFGSAAAVNTALGQLRAAARAQGLPGVYVVGGFGTPDGTMGQESLNDGFSIALSDGYDAVAFYNYPFAPPAVRGELPFSTARGTRANRSRVT